MEITKKNKIIITIILIIAILILFAIYLFTNKENYVEYNLDEAVSNVDNLLDENIIEDEKNQIETKESSINAEEDLDEIVIHITGAVKKEGIVYLKEGDRVIDAIKKAGGENKNADLSQVNLAYVLSDGQKVYIPTKNENIQDFIVEGGIGLSSIQANNTRNTSTEENSKININKADEKELDNLPGIGPTIAQRIVDYRIENGKFKDKEDIKNVSGIGDSKYEEIKDNITV